MELSAAVDHTTRKSFRGGEIQFLRTTQWEGAFPDMPETRVTLELQGSSDETLLTLRHEGFSEPGSRQQHRSGWMSACDRLNREVISPAPSLK